MELYSQPKKHAADSKGGHVVDSPLPPLPGQHYETPRSHPLPYVGPNTVTPTAGEGDDGFTNHLYEDMRTGATGSRQGAANCSSSGDRTLAVRQSTTNPMYASPSEVSVGKFKECSLLKCKTVLLQRRNFKSSAYQWNLDEQ